MTYHKSLITNHKVGIKTEFSLSVGKNYKYINKYIE
ncbi:aminoglycoside 6-adenylyltransferase [Enterococcus hirae]|nr:aminoglycoside 6-adenylyltransferase [Enterococcus hirae]